jgi:hypothetical protein
MKILAPLILMFFFSCEDPVTEVVYITNIDTIYIAEQGAPLPDVGVSVVHISSYTEEGIRYVDVSGKFWNDGPGNVWNTRISITTSDGYVYSTRTSPSFVGVGLIVDWESRGMQGNSVRQPVVSFAYENGQYP